MSAGDIKETVCFILHTKSYDERSLLVQALSYDLGRISFVANRVKGVKNKNKGFIQLFTPLRVSLRRVNSSLKSMYSVEQISKPFNLEVPKLYLGMYINELLVHLYNVQDESAELFDLYVETLEQLSNTQNDEYVLRLFELKLLDFLGLGIGLNQESPIRFKNDKYYFFKENEGLVESDLVLVENMAYKNYFLGADLNCFIEDKNITPKVLKTVKNLCRTLLEPLLQNKTIQSREIYKSFIDNKIRM